MTDTELIGTRAVAELLGKSVPTVNRLVNEGAIPTAGKIEASNGRGAWLYRRTDIEALRDAEPATSEVAS